LETRNVRLLVVSEWFPDPPVVGAKIRAYNLIRQLAKLADVDLVAQINTLAPEQVSLGTDRLKQICGSVESVSAIPYSRTLSKALRLLIDPVPATVRHKQNHALERLLAARLNTHYDAVIATISGSPSSTVHSLIKLGVRPLIVDSLELGVLRPKHSTPSLHRARNQFTWRHLRRYTRQVLKDVDIVTVTSEAERTLFADLTHTPDQCIVVPNVLDLSEYQGDFGPRDYNSLLYAGSFGYIANYQAMLWFAQEIFSRMRDQQALRVTVTGNTAGRNLRPLQDRCPQIQFTGFVDDIRPYFARSGICIVPILTGGSTRLKIIEAMAWGTPVVSTGVGAEGLEVTHDRDILLADTPEDFATSIERLVRDRDLWRRLSIAGRNLVAEHYSADHMYRQYRGILSVVTQGVLRPGQGSDA